LIVGDCGLSIGDPKTPLPDGWERVPMIEIARLESGHTPSRNRPDCWGGDIAWMGLVDARNNHGSTIHDTIQHTNPNGIANSAARLRQNLPSQPHICSKMAVN
jgi:type I restriction enzyme S subunit